MWLIASVFGIHSLFCTGFRKSDVSVYACCFNKKDTLNCLTSFSSDSCCTSQHFATPVSCGLRRFENKLIYVWERYSELRREAVWANQVTPIANVSLNAFLSQCMSHEELSRGEGKYWLLDAEQWPLLLEHAVCLILNETTSLPTTQNWLRECCTCKCLENNNDLNAWNGHAMKWPTFWIIYKFRFKTCS